MKKRMKLKKEKNKVKETDHRKFYKITDSELDDVEDVLINEQFVVYGNIELNDDEKKCLSLGPKFMITPDLNYEDYEFKVEIDELLAKLVTE